MQTNPQISLAPLQGFTDFHFRNAFQNCFGTLDRFYSPWIKLDGNQKLRNAQIRDVKPENNSGINLIPQIMCKNSEDFIFLANYLKDLGYDEINWNLGCPYPMVTKRGLGSAMLKTPEKIEKILDEVLPQIKNKLSLKMRLGSENESESLHLLPLLDKYPLTEIIIHARTANQMYKGKVNLDAFERCVALTKHNLAYNGDIVSVDSYNKFKNRFPQIKSFMIGRGLIANPFLAEMIKNDSAELPENYTDLFLEFHNHLLESYASHLSGEKHLLIKMKSYWEYFSLLFNDSHKAHKRIKKSKSIMAYKEAVRMNINGGFYEGH